MEIKVAQSYLLSLWTGNLQAEKRTDVVTPALYHKLYDADYKDFSRITSTL